MIPLQLPPTPHPRPTIHCPSYVPMMTRYCSRKHIPRPPHPHRTERITIRHGPIHHFRSLLLPRLFLSLFPLKPSPHPRTRRSMTTRRNQTPKPNRSTTTKHCHPTSLRSYRNMSPPQHHRSEPKTSNPRLNLNRSTRLLLHCTTSHRILRSAIFNRRRSLRLYILRSHRIPRPPRHYWFYIPASMFTSSNQIPFHAKPPLRI